MRSIPVMILLSAAGLACASRPTTPVSIVGPAADLSALAGHWDGSYEAENGPRHGWIEFELQAGRDTAFGDVLMIPGGWDRPSAPEDRTGAAIREVRLPKTLTIRFVQVSNGEVSGELDPYRDPDCGCQLQTVFRGRLKGDTLSGRYESLHQEGEPPVAGHWRVVRRAQP